MRKNSSEIEQRLITILKKNSRKNIVDIAEELGVSRITAKKALDGLVQNGRIRKFTVTLEEDEQDMALVYVDDVKEIPENLIVEQFRLMDDTYIAVLYYEDLMQVKNARIKRIEIAKSRITNDNITRLEDIHCDYCGKEIKSDPIMVEIAGRTFYACCPNCERDLKKRRQIMSSESK
ncbi:MAG: TRASH domain-containing protein [Thermoplasmataceae archaeon]